ncbi:MAG: hypothetical protein CUN55_00525 [Phototrophicales bacterium]|nr:MAG: hypothetical protein CUN55_00525 [Phototrophicales bacterium]
MTLPSRIDFGDPLYNDIVAKATADRGRIVDFQGELWTKYWDNANTFYIRIERGKIDPADKTGRWDRFYGPTDVRDEA